MNRRLLWITAAAIGLSASALFARQGVIYTRDGKTIEGEVIEEKPDSVIIAIRGIRTTVPRENIKGNVEYFDSVEARYQDKLKKLPKNATAKDHLDLARWLYDAKAYDLALQEIEAARKIDPNSADAATLEATVMSQRRMEKARAGAPGAPAAPTGAQPRTGATPGPAAAAAAGGPEKPHYLTAADVNTIRQMEWKENDPAPPRVVVPADLRRKFVDYKALDPGEFAALTMPQQAYYILREGLPEMRKDVKVNTDPASMAEFRRAVQPLVLNGCAAAGCHNANQHAGGFALYTNNADREDVAYTNFYILQKYQKTGGTPPSTMMMIDRTYPERSLLAQYALPPDHADLAKHPAIPGQAYRPLAASKSAPQYRTLVNWMKGLTAGEPNYGIEYALPGAAKDAPASKPAPAPAPAPKAGGAAAAPAAPARPAPAAPAGQPGAPRR